MEVYKIVAYVQSDIKRKDGSMHEEMICGKFIQYEHDEIMGKIDWERGLQKGYSFIKGLFVDKTKLIFVEITEDKHEKGFCFKNINEIGYHDYESDWLGGLFCGDSIFWTVYASVEQETELENAVECLETEYQQFCEGLSDWKLYLFQNIQKLRDFIE